MNEKKYKLTNEAMRFKDHTLHRIEALKDFGDVKKGDKGGWVESESNLSQKGNCWVGDDAQVYGDARVYGDAQVEGDAQVCGFSIVFGTAQVYGDAQVLGGSWVSANAKVYGCALVHDNARVYGDAQVCDSAQVYGYAKVYGCALVYDNAIVHDNARVYGDAQVCDSAQVYGYAKVGGTILVQGYAEICGDAVVEKMGDYMVFQNTWSSGRWFTHTKSNDKWKVGCFYGTGEELVKKAYVDGEEKGRCYEKVVNLVNQLKEGEK